MDAVYCVETLDTHPYIHRLSGWDGRNKQHQNSVNMEWGKKSNNEEAKKEGKKNQFKKYMNR